MSNFSAYKRWNSITSSEKSKASLYLLFESFLFESTFCCILNPLFPVLFMEMEIRPNLFSFIYCLQMQGLFSSSPLSYLFSAYFFHPLLLVCPFKVTHGPLCSHTSSPSSSLKRSSLNECKRLIHTLCESWLFTFQSVLAVFMTQ